MSVYSSIKKILIFIIIEIIAAIYLLSRCFISMADITIDAGAFYDNIKNKTNAEYIEDRGLVFVPEKGDPSTEAFTYEMPLRSGGYELTVYYEVEGIDEGDFEDDYYPITDHTVVGKVSLVSVHTSAIDMSDILLTNARKTATGRGYIRFGRTVPDVQVRISYPNTGKLTVKNIQIRQSRSYQFISLFSFILIFILFDLAVLLFMGILEGRGRQIIKRYGSVLFIGAVTFVLSAPFFNKFIIWGYDLDYHLMRISHIARELSYGQFPVRIYRDALDGYGYPSPIFYCDTFLFPSAVLYYLFLPLRTSYNLYVFLVNLATVSAAYFSCKAVCRDKRIAAVSTMVYTMCEFRVRFVIKSAAVGTYTAFIFFPLIAAAIYNIYTKEKPERRDRLCLAVGMAGLVSCHTLSFDITVIFLAIFAVIEWKRTFSKRIFFSLIAAAAEAALLSLYQLVPFVESYISLPLKGKLGESYIQDRGMEFVQFIQLFYGGEMERGGIAKSSLAFGIGAITAVILILYCMIISSKEEEKEKRHCLGVILIMTVISAFMASCYFPLDMVYDNMPEAFSPVYFLLSSIQFPIRYMSITISILMVGICVGLKYLKDEKKTSFRAFAWLLCIGSITAYSVYVGYVNNHCTVNKYTSSNINIDQAITGGEFLPGFDSWKITKDTDIIANDNVTITDIQRQDGELLFTVSSKAGETEYISLPVFNYGNYHAIGSDNTVFQLGADEEYRISIPIPEGYSGRIRLYYEESFLWRICEIISLISIAAVIYLSCKKKKV